MTLSTLVFRYGLFAIIATLTNLAAQRVVLLWFDGGAGLALAIAAGTGAGLIVKYLLDKRWIFFDTSRGARAHGEKFTRYTATGVVTTAIFWGTETAAWLIWRDDTARELGAILGLAVGYVVKFQLDRRFVFRQPAP